MPMEVDADDTRVLLIISLVSVALSWVRWWNASEAGVLGSNRI